LLVVGLSVESHAGNAVDKEIHSARQQLLYRFFLIRLGSNLDGHSKDASSWHSLRNKPSAFLPARLASATVLK